MFCENLGKVVSLAAYTTADMTGKDKCLQVINIYKKSRSGEEEREKKERKITNEQGAELRQVAI